jgi:hypothetical protein
MKDRQILRLAPRVFNLADSYVNDVLLLDI